MSEAREIERTLLIADLSGYTALTETHGALHASEVVLRFGRMAEASLEPGVVIVDRVGDPIARAALGVSGVESRSIGERRFKNVSFPVVIYELVRPGRVAEPAIIDPVCRMRVEIEHAAATLPYEGATYYFCSHECARLFSEAPERYLDP